MKDPDSFVIEKAFYIFNGPLSESSGPCAKAWKKFKERCIENYNQNVLGTTDFCFVYRSKNGYGGYTIRSVLYREEEDSTC
jgi:hypothetical protein